MLLIFLAPGYITLQQNGWKPEPTIINTRFNGSGLSDPDFYNRVNLNIYYYLDM